MMPLLQHQKFTSFDESMVDLSIQKFLESDYFQFYHMWLSVYSKVIRIYELRKFSLWIYLPYRMAVSVVKVYAKFLLVYFAIHKSFVKRKKFNSDCCYKSSIDLSTISKSCEKNLIFSPWLS